MTKSKWLFVGLFATFSLGFDLAQAQVCGELFRSTPHLQDVANRPFTDIWGRNAIGFNAPAPSHRRLLKAAEADVLGLERFSDRAKHSLRRIFSVLELDRVRAENVLVEIHRRRYENIIREMGLEVRTDLATRLAQAKPYLSVVFSAAANSAANFLAYRYLDTFGIIVHVPTVRIFDARKVPDDVLIELIATPGDQPVPKTRAYVSTKIRHSVDIVVETVRRTFNYGILAVLLVARGDMITNPSHAIRKQLDETASGMHDATLAKNATTLKLIAEKRARYLAEGKGDKVKQADELIFDIQKQNEELKKRGVK